MRLLPVQARSCALSSPRCSVDLAEGACLHLSHRRIRTSRLSRKYKENENIFCSSNSNYNNSSTNNNARRKWRHWTASAHGGDRADDGGRADGGAGSNSGGRCVETDA